MKKIRPSIYCLPLLMSASVNANWQEQGQHLKLIDLLDRTDGYCIDVAGSGNHVRFDLPLLTHNCKEGLYADEAVIHNDDGTISFPAYNGCVTVMGVNDHALPYNALMIKQCNVDSPFLNATKFQKFKFNKDNQVQLIGTALCITTGDTSEITFSPNHRWRSLYMQECSLADKKRSQWKLVTPT